MFELYVVTDDTMSRGLSHARVAEEALKGGADAVQLRMKGSSREEMTAQALEIAALTGGYGAFFIVNDDLEVALASGADGVHIGQGDMSLEEARARAGESFIIGVSVSCLEEALEAEEDGADYIGFGPVFETSSKPDAGAPLGLDALQEVCSAVSIPVVAIGGISADNMRQVIAAGADGIAVISAVVAAGDIARAARDLRRGVMETKRSLGIL
ncbi:MAG: thiamine phosphate synthase [Candidatus Methanomethylophilaceae archaeon]|jgi:thiamine-phosphate pyrophosphorylase|nr:thiamine phosphate synthase [Candidatus Methanomethylophilaceae archaeon]